MWHERQSAFARALADPSKAAPAGFHVKRFNVYRNNVAVGLREAMIDTYPVVRAIVGEDFFDAMAQVFVQHNRPATPVMLDYGAGFADFIDGFEPSRALPYLADVARLEWAWTRAYHAADAAPIDIAELARVPAEGAAAVRLELHPSLRMIVSSWPVASIWQAHQMRERDFDLPDHGEHILVLRPHLDVEVRSVDAPAFAFTSALANGMTLGEIQERSPDTFDLAGHLRALFEIGAVVGIRHS